MQTNFFVHGVDKISVGPAEGKNDTGSPYCVRHINITGANGEAIEITCFGDSEIKFEWLAQRK